MLTLTDQATTVVKTIADQTPDLEGVGLRISAQDTGSQSLDLSVVANPEPADQVIDSEGALVFLEPNAAVLLDDKVLDARIEENGAVSFAIGVL
jgi:iron-sulfur cluster assembly protein